MKHSTSVYMRRMRVHLNPNEACVIATALIAGAPLPTPDDWSRQARELAARVTWHWIDDDYAPFPTLTPSADATRAVDELAALLSGDGPYYADYFAFHYAHVVHAHVCVWSGTTTQDTLALRTSADIESFWTSTRSAGLSPRPSLLDNPISDAELINTLLNPDSTPPDRTLPIIPFRLARVFDVDTLSGPSLDDSVWIRQFPSEGTDIVFDTTYPRGVEGYYLLNQRNYLM